jgi:hypothetical protein
MRDQRCGEGIYNHRLEGDFQRKFQKGIPKETIAAA